MVQAQYTSRLVSGRKNHGECGVLALAEVRGHTAVVDDRVARQIGEERGVLVTGTLALLCESMSPGHGNRTGFDATGARSSPPGG
jgi:predicted nucleic acid-binding protein